MVFEFLDLRLVLRFRVREVGGEFLNLRLVLRFRVREMVFEFLDFTLVPRFSLREELAIEMLDLRKPFWNEGIQPAHPARKQIGPV